MDNRAVVIAVEEDEEYGDYVVYLNKPVIHPMLREIDGEQKINKEYWNHILVDDPPEVGRIIEFAYYDGWHWTYTDQI